MEDKNNHKTLEKFHFFRWKDSKIIGEDYSTDPIFGIYKEFSNDGIIRTKGMECFYGFIFGNWFYYDEKGRLIKTVNNDEGYEFGIEDVFFFCQKNSIPLETNREKIDDSLRPIKILKQRMPDGKLIWIISYADGVSIKTYWLNGKNGKIIKTFLNPMPVE
ncbi:hypothetical protein [Mucilaginibacter sp.]